jgi:hypothetical protein
MVHESLVLLNHLYLTLSKCLPRDAAVTFTRFNLRTYYKSHLKCLRCLSLSLLLCLCLSLPLSLSGLETAYFSVTDVIYESPLQTLQLIANLIT